MKSSHRDVFRAAVLSALVSVTPLSVLKGADGEGEGPPVIALADGSRLIIQKIGGVGRGPIHYRATRKVGDKVVDEKPTGSFTGKNGQVIVLDQGKVLRPEALLRLERAR